MNHSSRTVLEMEPGNYQLAPGPATVEADSCRPSQAAETSECQNRQAREAGKRKAAAQRASLGLRRRTADTETVLVTGLDSVRRVGCHDHRPGARLMDLVQAEERSDSAAATSRWYTV